MLGHKAYQVFSEYYETYVTFRSYGKQYQDLGIFSDAQIIDKVDAFDMDIVTRAIRDTRPEIVLNCIGITKQREEAKNPRISIYINALFPHLVAEACREVGAKLIQVSTDCVFSGNKGMYSEDDIPDPVDLYGRSKLLGEVSTGNALTIRKSVIGRELHGRTGLLEWVLSQKGKRVNGFAKAIYTGLTTDALCRVIREILLNHSDLSGIWQVASEPINKFDLLMQLNSSLGLEMTIDRDEDFVCDRSLDGSRFRERTGIIVPSWPEMIEDLRKYI